MEKFGTLLRQERKKAGVRLGTLAQHLDVRVSHLSDIELGRRAPLSQVRIRRAGELLPEADVTRLLLAAAVQKGVFEFDTEGVSDRKRQMVAALARELPALSDQQLERIERAIVSPGEQEE